MHDDVVETASSVLPALVEDPLCRLAVIVACYALTLATSGLVVRLVAGHPAADESAPSDPTEVVRRKRLGSIIGKCENLIAVTFILAHEETGLALIFAAKSIVRREDMRDDPDYYLGGTLVNLVWSLLLAFTARTLVEGL